MNLKANSQLKESVLSELSDISDISEKNSSNHPQQIKLDPSWKKLLVDEFQKPYMQEIKQFLKTEKTAGKIIFPKGDDIFAALNTTPFDKVKVVIIGQDPYHGINQAHGLCFSVMPEVDIPPSLKNIYKELKNDLSLDIPAHGFLMKWGQQGVLLLNAVLTVEAGKANSHQGKGWELFTDKIVHLINELRENVVFVLWGSYAQKKGSFIDRERHFVIEAPHPSPLSSHRGFFGSKPFSKINNYLLAHGNKPIDWKL